MQRFDPIDRSISAKSSREKPRHSGGSTYDAINWNSFNQLNGPEFIERSQKRVARVTRGTLIE